MEDRKLTLELDERDSAIIILSLELREMHFPPLNATDRRRLPELKKELTAKHNQIFIPLNNKQRSR